MTRITIRRIRRHLPGRVLAALAIITALIVAPVTAAADARPGGSATATALTQAFQSSRHIPVGSPGS